jgi:hypothetical protein
MEEMKETGVIDELSESVNKLLDETNDIESLLILWKEITNGKKQMETLDERLRTKIKTYLKERKWERYIDEKTGTSVTISSFKQEVFDKQQLKLMLTESQLAQITRITTIERLSIITPETRARLSKIVQKSKRKDFAEVKEKEEKS